MRNEHDSILVGIGTVLADNPQLTCRMPGGRNPHRVVLDRDLRTPLDRYVVTQAPGVPTTIFCGSNAPATRRQALEAAGPRIAVAHETDAGLDLRDVLEQLSALGILSVMVEGGAAVITSFYRNDLADRVVLVCAPLLIGTGTEAVGDLGVTELAGARRGRTIDVYRAGDDVVWEFTLRE
jgi:riboflavin-specific deaminase-like protein